MQADLDTVAKAQPIDLLGVNAAGLESGNAETCNGRTIPWLQDTPQANVWAAWQVTYRDVVILDAENRVIQAYNLSTHNLANPADYAALRAILLAAAQ